MRKGPYIEEGPFLICLQFSIFNGYDVIAVRGLFMLGNFEGSK